MALLSPTVGGLRELLQVCEVYAGVHGLIYNVKKSEYMIFGATSKRPATHNITLNGLSINRVTKFKYLGHFLTDNLKDDEDIERERRALAIRGNMLARRFSRCSYQVKITLFKAYCQSFYTGNLWVSYTKRSLDALRVQYNNIFRMMLRLPRFCSASGMFALHHTDGFHAVRRKRTASLIARMRGGNNVILNTVSDRISSRMWRSLVRLVI